MKKISGPKIIQISGIGGLFLAGFIVACLFAGFIVFPAKFSMYVWNYIGSHYLALPEINVIQGGLLCFTIALGLYLLNDGKFAVSFHNSAELSDEEFKSLMSKVKAQHPSEHFEAKIISAEDFEKIISKRILKVQKSEETEKDNKKDAATKP